MKVLFVLTYYRPYVSGLTIYVQRLAEAMAARGHHVTVLTSQFEPDLPREDEIGGVRVVRAPVAFKVSKGVLMPRFPHLAYELAREHDVLSVHLPQFEAGLVSAIGRVAGRPVILTYHCDLELPPGLFNRVVDQVVFGMNWVGGVLSDAVVAYTADFANHSRFLCRFRSKVQVIPPPVVMAPVLPGAREAFRAKYGLGNGVVVGICTRVATEKGIEYVLEAIPQLETALGDVHILHAGQYRNVLGEEAYWERLQPLLQRYEGRVTFTGVLGPDQLPAFFAACDVLVVSSVNSTESFGLVQVEAMLCGTPVVATNLPGVREPVRMTGMGQVVPVRDSGAIARAVAEVIAHRARYVQPRERIAALFDLGNTVRQYEELFAEYAPGSVVAVS